VKNKPLSRYRHEMNVNNTIVINTNYEVTSYTQTVILSVGLLLIFTSTWIISSILALNCHGNVIHLAMDEEETAEAVVEQCGRYYWPISYTRMVQLVALSFYQSVSYVKRSRILCSLLVQP